AKNQIQAIAEMEFQRCFEDWRNRWHKCTASNGDYFESHQMVIAERMNNLNLDLSWNFLNRVVYSFTEYTD
ncbi:hypothetical protein WH47_02336, partial [Habropoda laboriosa]